MITSLRPGLLAFLFCAVLAIVGAYAQEEGSGPADEFFPLPDAVVGQSPAVQARKLPSVNSSGRLDVLQLKDMDINDVLNLLSSRTGLNIVAGKGVQGRVTLFLKDVDARAVLALILKSNGFAYEEHAGIIEVMSAGEYEKRHGAAFGIDMQTELFNLDYIGADMAAKALGSILTRDTGTVQIDDASGELVVTDTVANMERVRRMLAALDKPQKETRTEVFKLSYLKAEDAARSLVSVLTKESGKIDIDQVSNALVVTDTVRNVERVRRVVESLDKHQKEALIEARIVQLSLSEGQNSGVDWSAWIPQQERYHVELTGDFELGSVNKIATIGTLSRDGYQAVIQALATTGTTKTLSKPSIAVINNQEARIHIGKTQPYVTTSQTVSATGPSTTAETVSFIDVGVKLNVTPMIHDDGYITMKIRPEVSTATEFITTGEQKNQIPIVNTSEVETTVRVKDGVTIVIGGLIKDDAAVGNSRVPVLGDIPFLGRAFRSDTRSTTKEEIVIFLTPHIISGDAPVDPDTYFLLKGYKSY